MVKLHACRSLTSGDDEIKIFASLLQPHLALLSLISYCILYLYLYFVLHDHGDQKNCTIIAASNLIFFYSLLNSYFLCCVLYFIFVICIWYCVEIKIFAPILQPHLPLSDPHVLHCQIGVYCVVMQYIVRSVNIAW